MPMWVFWILVVFMIALSVLGAGVTYLLSVLFTGRLALNLLLSALVFLAICYTLVRALARSVSLARVHRTAILITVAALSVTSLAVAYPTLYESWKARSTPPASDRVIETLRTQALVLDSVDVASGFEDLQPLKPILANKRIVALGEATHGTSEFFRAKHRLLEFLVYEMGYRHFGMETGSETAAVIRDYIAGGDQDPRHVLYWPWGTVEVMDMLNWMRAYNADPAHTQKLSFHGIDPIVGQRDEVMAENVQRILTQEGPETKIVLWTHNAHVSNQPGAMGHDLKQRFGDQAYLLGFEFDHGAFTSRMLTVHTYRVGPASPAYYAHALARVGSPFLFLDMQTLQREPVLLDWLQEKTSSHSFCELHAVYRLHPAWHTQYTSWLTLYDGILYVQESTPALTLP